MKIDGSPVKSSRLFLGEEHRIKAEKLAKYFSVQKFYYQSLVFNKDLFEEFIA